MSLETRPNGDVLDTFHSPDNDPVRRWHPKITIYRLAVLLTTICLGVGKAITSARCAVVVPVTFEWVSGVVVFVFLYCVGLYNEDHRQLMKWLFNHDLAVHLWPVLYRTDEVDLPAGFHLSRHPPITGYRIVVTASVLLFGLAKVMLGYLGYPVAANTVDWIYGVVVTSGFYCIGLYENNSLNLFSAFFARDYGPFLRHVFFFAIPIYTPAIILYSGIVYAAMKTLIYQWSHPVNLSPDIKMPFLAYAFGVSVNLMILEILFLIAGMGIYAFCCMLYGIKVEEGIRWRIRGGLNISRAEELPPPYYKQNDGKVKYYVNTPKYMLQLFTLVFTGTLTTVMTCLSFWITEDTFAISTEWWAILFCLYYSATPWALTFVIFGFFMSIFVHLIQGTFFWE